MDPKQRAGEAALSWIKDGMIVGLGSGSTAKCFIESLGAAVRAGKIRNIRGVPTSVASEKLAREYDLPIVGFDTIERIDVTVDGADEVDPDLNLIKGLGGALLREKLVAQNSSKLVIIVDATKVVTTLGTKGPLPVEVTVFGHDASRRFLQSLDCVPTLRMTGEGRPYLTDNGNYIYDCKFSAIGDAVKLNDVLGARAGIVESGLFIGLASAAIVAGETGIRTISRR
jgi:ribose 5-phosphate isomerase A